jgi:hypothetical protein
MQTWIIAYYPSSTEEPYMAIPDYQSIIATQLHFATDENEYSLQESIMRELGDRPRFSIRPLSIGRITVVKLLLILMKECKHNPFNRVIWWERKAVAVTRK